jgi:two-component system chemotaxis sensor kinase CheA
LSDREALEVIFTPGFSTAREVSSLSGRGVGTDIVATNVHRLNGAVRVESTPGRGTTFTLELPLTLAIMEALLVSLRNNIFAIPLASVIETLRVRSSDLKSINKEKVIQLRGQVLPLLPLENLASCRERSNSTWTGREWAYVVVVGTESDKVGIVVDSLVGEQQVVIKSLGKLIGDVRGISGATILGDGSVALILDVSALVKKRLQERAVELIYA